MPNKSKDSRQAGMTPKINIQFSDALRSLPQGSSLQEQLYLILKITQGDLLFQML